CAVRWTRSVPNWENTAGCCYALPAPSNWSASWWRLFRKRLHRLRPTDSPAWSPPPRRGRTTGTIRAWHEWSVRPRSASGTYTVFPKGLANTTHDRYVDNRVLTTSGTE